MKTENIKKWANIDIKNENVIKFYNTSESLQLFIDKLPNDKINIPQQVIINNMNNIQALDHENNNNRHNGINVNVNNTQQAGDIKIFCLIF
jgi:hypothetical protein